MMVTFEEAQMNMTLTRMDIAEALDSIAITTKQLNYCEQKSSSTSVEIVETF